MLRDNLAAAVLAFAAVGAPGCRGAPAVDAAPATAAALPATSSSSVVPELPATSSSSVAPELPGAPSSSVAPGRADASPAAGDGAVATGRAAPPRAPGDPAEPTPAPGAAGSRGSAPPDMALVPAGPFTMGADRGGEPDERPAHAVDVRAFYLDRTEVTNAAYAACVAEGKCRQKHLAIAVETGAGPDARFQRPAQPVVGVSWDDARAFCAARGKRLPTEAEWEKAARGADGRRFPWGDASPTKAHAVFGRALGRDAPDDVGTHPEGRGPYGHDDLAGNVWEWVEDVYDPYAYVRAGAGEGRPGGCDAVLAAQDELRAQHKQGFTGSNPIPTECERVLRGGAFNYPPEGLRASNRVHHPGRFRLVMSGFRCARDAE